MPKLTVQNLAECEVEVEKGQTILQALQQAGQDWMHACGAKGRCTTCRIIVKEGLAHFSALSDSEHRYRGKGRLKNNERLTCQCTLETGNALGVVPRQTKLPHLTYTD